MPRTNVRFVLCLMLICWTAAVVPASAQHFQQMSGSLSQIAAGHSEVWGLKFPGGQIYRFSPSTQSFNQVPGSLSQIAVGGGTLLVSDQVWGVNGAGVFSFNLGTNAYTQRNPPGAATFFNHIAVGKGGVWEAEGCYPYEVWGLASSVPASSGLPYRYNWCEGRFFQVPLPSGSTVPFTRIATGGGDVWALDANAQIWHFTGQWTGIGGGYHGTLQQITVGVNDVWGLDGNGAIYRYDPYLGYFVPFQLPSTGFAQIAAGGDGVWGVGQNVTLYNGFRLDSLAAEFVDVGSFWTQVAVGSGAGVWVINSSDEVFVWVRP